MERALKCKKGRGMREIVRCGFGGTDRDRCWCRTLLKVSFHSKCCTLYEMTPLVARYVLLLQSLFVLLNSARGKPTFVSFVFVQLKECIQQFYTTTTTTIVVVVFFFFL